MYAGCREAVRILGAREAKSMQGARETVSVQGTWMWPRQGEEKQHPCLMLAFWCLILPLTVALPCSIRSPLYVEGETCDLRGADGQDLDPPW